MATSANLRIFATSGSYHQHLLCSSLPSSKVEFTGSINGGYNTSKVSSRWSSIIINSQNPRSQSRPLSVTKGEYDLAKNSINREAENFLLKTINMSFLDRLKFAWKIVFPSPTSRKNSNARIAKQRLKMILLSERCAVSDEAKRKIVNNIVQSLSDVVEIESRDKVQLDVTTDTDLGTIYSVAVPVRRVKPEFEDSSEAGTITDIEYKDTGETSGSVDVRFGFYVPE